MRRPNSAGVVALGFALALGGCGSGSSIPEGTLEVANSSVSRDVVVGVELVETIGPNFLAYDVWACPGDSVCLDLYPSLYDVTTAWERGGIATYFNVRVREGCTTEVCVRR